MNKIEQTVFEIFKKDVKCYIHAGYALANLFAAGCFLVHDNKATAGFKSIRTAFNGVADIMERPIKERAKFIKKCDRIKAYIQKNSSDKAKMKELVRHSWASSEIQSLLDGTGK